jgi:6-phosphogluconolactonase
MSAPEKSDLDASIRAFPTLKEACEALAHDAADWLRAALQENGRASIAVPGGTSPAPFFRTLAQADLDWSKVRVTLTDERYVPLESDESNSRLLRQTFLQGRAAAAQFVMPDLNASLEDAAKEWDAQIRAAPAFDLVVLGMGEDGHFASLFPASPALVQGLNLDADCYALPAQDKSPQRLSLTLRALTNTRHLVFLVGGATKREIIQNVLRNAAGVETLPISTLLRQSPVKPVFFWGAAS